MAAKRRKPVNSESEPRTHPIGLHVVGGVIWGFVIGLMLSLWATVVYLFAGQEAFRDVGTTYGQAVLLYLSGGVLVGGMFGLVRPWIRGKWSAAAFGFVAGCVLFSIVLFAIGRFDPLVVVLTAAILGPAIGWRYWEMFS